MSKWTHSICTPCWNRKNPQRRAVSRKEEGPDATCCWCGKQTTSGIYLREDPSVLMCNGTHDDD